MSITATTDIYTLSLHDALPISSVENAESDAENPVRDLDYGFEGDNSPTQVVEHGDWRSEEHTSELQSLTNLVCRLLLEKKKKNDKHVYISIWGTTRLPPLSLAY